MEPTIATIIVGALSFIAALIGARVTRAGQLQASIQPETSEIMSALKHEVDFWRARSISLEQKVEEQGRLLQQYMAKIDMLELKLKRNES